MHDVVYGVHAKWSARRSLILLCLLVTAPLPASADWTVVERQNPDTGKKTAIARTTNEEGYSLEIYRDSVGAVRTRFSLRNGLTSLSEHDCPTYQIDKAVPVNRSFNGAICLSNSRWAEFILDYVKDNSVDSKRLLALMNGNVITFRFHLASGDYRDTRFSLAGSKRSVVAAMGAGITFNGH